MIEVVTAESLHRGAKYFMDIGRAGSASEAMELLRSFGLSIVVGPELVTSRDHQVALLTLVNCSRRTLLGGIEVIGAPSAPNLTHLAVSGSIADAVEELGGSLARTPRSEWPLACIGTIDSPWNTKGAWQLTWSGWRGGVTPLSSRARLAEDNNSGLAPALSAAVCAAEAFALHSGNHVMSGRRATGLSLWKPGVDWLAPDGSEPTIAYLPSNLWLIGLGNLGQAYLWLLGSLPFERPNDLELMLQDIDRISQSNDSTSLLSSVRMVGQMKTRAMALWAERRGFRCFLEERRFGPHTCCEPAEPAVALCGVDNALARRSLETAGFEWVVETGLGAGPASFSNFSLHTFPGSLKAVELWSDNATAQAEGSGPGEVSQLPAYRPALHPSLDECGLTQLASRTVGVPFVGLIAATLAIAEVLRRLHGGDTLEVVSGSAAALEDVEAVGRNAEPYSFGYTSAATPRPGPPMQFTHGEVIPNECIRT